MMDFWSLNRARLPSSSGWCHMTQKYATTKMISPAIVTDKPNPGGGVWMIERIGKNRHISQKYAYSRHSRTEMPLAAMISLSFDPSPSEVVIQYLLEILCVFSPLKLSISSS
jgi:hypothetical protein